MFTSLAEDSKNLEQWAGENVDDTHLGKRKTKVLRPRRPEKKGKIIRSPPEEELASNETTPEPSGGGDEGNTMTVTMMMTMMMEGVVIPYLVKLVEGVIIVCRLFDLPGRQISPIPHEIKIMVNPYHNGGRQATDIDLILGKVIAPAQ
jgi:hypothetical protein